jgi:hypothetical protein
MKKTKKSLPSCYELMEGHNTGWNTYSDKDSGPTDPRWETMNVDRDLGTEYMDSAAEVESRVRRAR